MKRPTVVMIGVCASLLVSGFEARAQETRVYPDVLREDKHDVSPPLHAVRPLLTTDGQRVIPLRPVTPATMKQDQPDPVLQSTPGPLVSSSPGSFFDGVGANGYAPPDTTGAAGLTQYVQWVNVQFGVFDKTTKALVYGPAAGNTLWNGFSGPCATSNDGDPIAQYDKLANRWVMAQPVFTSPYMYCIAVSTTSDATGSYYRYAFSMPNFPDYPKLGVWSDGYYATFNLFNGNFFAGGYACAFDRAKMLAGQPATAQCFTTPYGSLLPSDVDGPAPPANEPAFFLNFGTNSLNLWKMHVDFANSANSTFTGPTNIPVAAFSQACGGGVCVPQPGTAQKLDSLGDRLMYRLAYRNSGDHESLVVNHSIVAGTSVGVRWYELRSPNGTPTVFQQGTFAPDANYRWMGSIAMDKSGDIAVGYSASNASNLFPSIYYTGRVPTDALGTMQTESLLKAGAGSQTSGLSRWGDYSAMSVDPVDDCTFWYTTEYLKASGSFNWSTHIASFKFPSCGGVVTPDFTLGASPTSQTVTAGNNTSYNVTVTGLNGYGGIVSSSVSGLPTGASPTFTPGSVTGSGSTTLTIATSAGTAAGTYPLVITGTDSTLTHTANVTLVVNSAPTGDFSITASPPSQTVVRPSSTSYLVTITGTGGFTGSVSFSVSGLPQRASASFSPISVIGSGPSTLTVKTNKKTVTGTFTLTIKGTSGSLVHSTQVGLTVQ